MQAPGLFLLAWQIGVSPNGKQLSNGLRLREAIHREYSTSIDASNLRGFPIINSAYIYNDCIVSAMTCVHPERDHKISFGFMTLRGQMVRFDGLGTPELAGDKTIASLLGSIQVVLDTPFNRFFAYPDQSNSTELYQHPHSGYTQWLTEPDEIKDVWR